VFDVISACSKRFLEMHKKYMCQHQSSDHVIVLECFCNSQM